MKSIFAAFVFGMMVMAAASYPAPKAPAAEGSLYYDMGTIHVQFSHKECGYRTLAVQYQIEYTDPQRTTYITAYKPKIEALLFAALSDHLNDTQNTRAKRVKRVMMKGIEEALGEGIAADVLVTEMQVIKL